MAEITLPIELPMDFEGSTEYTVSLPVTLPMGFDDNSTYSVTLPVTIPMEFLRVGQVKRNIYILYKETTNFDEYHGKTSIPYKESADG